jgi:hypothetical protein
MPLLDIVHPDDVDGETLHFQTNAEGWGFEFKVSGENVQFEANNNIYRFIPSGITVKLNLENRVHVTIPGESQVNFVERWENDELRNKIIAVLNRLIDNPIAGNNNNNNNNNQAGNIINLDGNVNVNGGRYKKPKSRKLRKRRKARKTHRKY